MGEHGEEPAQPYLSRHGVVEVRVRVGIREGEAHVADLLRNLDDEVLVALVTLSDRLLERDDEEAAMSETKSGERIERKKCWITIKWKLSLPSFIISLLALLQF